MNNTLLIIGRSPIIDTILPNIHYLIEMYPSVGINSISTIIKTKYCAFVDESFKYYLSKMNNDIELITLQKYIALSQKYKGNFYETYRPHRKSIEVLQEGKLAYFGFTHDLCLSWAVLNNFKNVVLIGAADFCSDVYADINANVYTPTFNRNKSVEDESINAINNIYTKHLNIFTLNKDSRLTVPRITVEELYNKDF